MWIEAVEREALKRRASSHLCRNDDELRGNLNHLHFFNFRSLVKSPGILIILKEVLEERISVIYWPVTGLVLLASRTHARTHTRTAHYTLHTLLLTVRV